jgi:DNA (cytosine-5)-methyltransferase 1
MGYHAAGFDVTGVDLAPQPNYPAIFPFIQADAIEVLADRSFVAGFDAIHASPPCQAHTALRVVTGKAYADLIPATRAGLEAAGLPWAMENVPGAPVEQHVILCGSMFGLGAEGRILRRHRLFETSGVGLVLTPPDGCAGRPVGGYYGTGGGGQYARGYRFRLAAGSEAMGIGWMNSAELSQAIPPAYTAFLGEHLMAAATVRAMGGAA